MKIFNGSSIASEKKACLYDVDAAFGPYDGEMGARAKC
jgi:hypothetical protein